MKLILFHASGAEKPYAVVGFDQDGVLFQEGLPDFMASWVLEGELFHPGLDKLVSAEDDPELFLDTVKFLVNTATSEGVDGRTKVVGPEEVTQIPQVESATEVTQEGVSPSDEPGEVE